MGYANNASLFRRAAFEGVGGYPSKSFGADAALDAAFSRLAHAVDPLRGDNELTRGEWFYIYRWGVNPVHMPGSGVEDFYREVGKPASRGRALPAISSLEEGLRSRNPQTAGVPRGAARYA